jgi:hypothetical protein
MMPVSTSLLHTRASILVCTSMLHIQFFLCVQRIVCLQCVQHRSACAVRAQLYAHQRKCLVYKVNVAACRVLPFVELVCLCYSSMLCCVLSTTHR